MKAVVVEIRNKDMVIMDQSGCFHRIKHDAISKIGDEILISNPKVVMLNAFKKWTAAAAVLLILTSSGYGAVSYYTPYTYVNIDINPSVELVLNKYSKVLDIKTLNEDSKKIVSDKKSFRHKKVENVVEQLLENAQTQNIISDDKENDILFTVSSKNEKSINSLNQRLQSASKKKLEKINNKYEIMLEKVSLSKHDEAKKKNISPGKILLYERLKEVKPDAKLEDVQKTSVRDTVKTIRQLKNDAELKKINERKIREELKNKIKENNKKQENKNNTVNIQEQKVRPVVNSIIENKIDTVQSEANILKSEDNENIKSKVEQLKEKIKEKKTNQIERQKDEDKIESRKNGSIIKEKIKEKENEKIEEKVKPNRDDSESNSTDKDLNNEKSRREKLKNIREKLKK